jgi:hypothetical protein
MPMFLLPLSGDNSRYGDFSRYGEVAAVLDKDLGRAAAYNNRLAQPIPAYGPDEFDRMVDETQPDVVVATGPDGTHVDYIVAGLRRDIDVLTEKPMVVDCEQARTVLKAAERSQGSVRVLHNSRYQSAHMAIKNMIADGLVGRITNVELIWNLDTFHGASYFYRWNRYRDISGGLTITKACHHFDLVNWWLDDIPEEVFAYGALNYYGPDSPHRPRPVDGRRLPVAEERRQCSYRRRWNSVGQDAADDHLRPRENDFDLPYALQYPPERPMYIYDEDITIEDTYSAVVRFRGGASMSYSLNASSPWEGYILAINGTRGRIETRSYTSPSRCPFPAEPQTVTYIPLFGERQVHGVARSAGEGHGGSDLLIKQEIFVGPLPETEKLGLAANALSSAYAVATGEAVWRSVESGRPVNIEGLLWGGESVMAGG